MAAVILVDYIHLFYTQKGLCENEHSLGWKARMSQWRK